VNAVLPHLLRARELRRQVFARRVLQIGLARWSTRLSRATDDNSECGPPNRSARQRRWAPPASLAFKHVFLPTGKARRFVAASPVRREGAVIRRGVGSCGRSGWALPSRSDEAEHDAWHRQVVSLAHSITRTDSWGHWYGFSSVVPAERCLRLVAGCWGGFRIGGTCRLIWAIHCRISQGTGTYLSSGTRSSSPRPVIFTQLLEASCGTVRRREGGCARSFLMASCGSALHSLRSSLFDTRTLRVLVPRSPAANWRGADAVNVTALPRRPLFTRVIERSSGIEAVSQPNEDAGIRSEGAVAGAEAAFAGCGIVAVSSEGAAPFGGRSSTGPRSSPFVALVDTGVCRPSHAVTTASSARSSIRVHVEFLDMRTTRLRWPWLSISSRNVSRQGVPCSI
jgi:hypothetical protein